MTISRLARTRLIKRFSEGNFHSLRSAIAISGRIGLRGGGILGWRGARGTDLYDREVMSVGLLIGVGVALVAGSWTSLRCIGPLYPQPR
jgi:hypothetical protein